MAQLKTDKTKQEPQNQPTVENGLKSLELKQKIRRWLPIALLVVIFGLAGTTVYNRFVIRNRQDAPIISSFDQLIKREPKEKKIISPLNGELVSQSDAQRWPLAIVIENHPEARPQSGLANASIVYEALAEGGITRFLAIFGPTGAEKIGPVRSARTFFIDWALEYDGFFVHAGGALNALELISKVGIKDLPHANTANKAFWRIPKPGTASEHTLFVSSSKLIEYAQSRGFKTNDYSFDGFSFDQPANQADRPENQKIGINFSTDPYQVTWVFDQQTNLYKRQLAGIDHTDGSTQAQISASTIIIQQAAHQNVTSGGKNVSDYATVGQGRAVLIKNGKSDQGTWKKVSRKDRTIFTDSNGKLFKRNPGSLWIEVVPPDTNVVVE